MQNFMQNLQLPNPYCYPIFAMEPSELQKLENAYTKALKTHGAHKSQSLASNPTEKPGYNYLHHLLGCLYQKYPKLETLASHCTWDTEPENLSLYFLAFTGNYKTEKLLKCLSKAASQDIYPAGIFYHEENQTILVTIIYNP